MALDDDMAGGYSQYYNPSFGLMAIQQPDMFVQHLASKGVQPPPDFEEGFTHMDAHQAMGGGKDQGRAPGMGETQMPAGQLPQQGNFEERFSDTFHGPPGIPYTDPETGQGSDTTPAHRPMPPIAPLNPDTSTPPAAKSPGPKAVYDAPSASQRPKFGQFLYPLGEEPGARPKPNVGFPSSIPGYKAPAPEAAAAPLKKPDEKPTPAADIPATVAGATVPAGSKEEHPGGLDKEDPTAKTSSTKEKKEDKSNAWDSFGKALAGVSAMKPPQVQFPHPGNIPHPGNQISRSTVPTELLKELSSIGHPGQLLRLGAALKGG